MEESSSFAPQEEFEKYNKKNNVITYDHIKLVKDKSTLASNNDLVKFIDDTKQELLNNLNTNFENFYENIAQNTTNPIVKDVIEKQPFEFKVFIKSIFSQHDYHLSYYEKETNTYK
ncbi:hypothetical protein [Chryseobacterium vrystaatense]|uniref:Uncharacterized protein n=1 Tax=Chryseobacterium vrystaatense TaxID=307480 RepID=A0A1M4UWC2_9FLAO|nr:hypothetical protein [Chryseobacterium vrystaatense]SHE60947.1 hypothetical protein SAMN02787073_0738 [Chryseobacterium vrystaatense]